MNLKTFISLVWVVDLADVFKKPKQIIQKIDYTGRNEIDMLESISSQAQNMGTQKNTVEATNGKEEFILMKPKIENLQTRK